MFEGSTADRATEGSEAMFGAGASDNTGKTPETWPQPATLRKPGGRPSLSNRLFRAK